MKKKYVFISQLNYQIFKTENKMSQTENIWINTAFATGVAIILGGLVATALPFFGISAAVGLGAGLAIATLGTTGIGVFCAVKSVLSYFKDKDDEKALAYAIASLSAAAMSNLPGAALDYLNETQAQPETPAAAAAFNPAVARASGLQITTPATTAGTPTVTVQRSI